MERDLALQNIRPSQEPEDGEERMSADPLEEDLTLSMQRKSGLRERSTSRRMTLDRERSLGDIHPTKNLGQISRGHSQNHSHSIERDETVYNEVYEAPLDDTVARNEREKERNRDDEDEDMPSAIEGFAGGFLPSVAGSMIEGGLISGVGGNDVSKAGADRSKFASTRREEVDGDFPAEELPSGIEPLSSFRERQQPREKVRSAGEDS